MTDTGAQALLLERVPPDRRHKGLVLAPTWSQLTDLAGSPRESYQAASMDCGEECVSMVLSAVCAVYTTEQQVREAMNVPAVNLGTSGGMLQSGLLHWGVTSFLLNTSRVDLRRTLKGVVDRGWYSIVLGTWVSPLIDHWVLTRGYGSGYLHVNDPWFGTERAIPWMTVLEQYRGQVVVVPYQYHALVHPL